MATRTLLLQLTVLLTIAMTTTMAGKTFRLRTIGLRAARAQKTTVGVVLERITQLTSLVNGLQETVNAIQQTVNHINDSVDPAVTSRYSSQLCCVNVWPIESL